MNVFTLPGLLLVEERKGTRVVIRARGELDLRSAEQLLAMLPQNGAPKDDVLIDLRGVTFIDCSGLRALMYASQLAARDGYRLHLIRGNRAVERLLSLTGTEGVFTFVDAERRCA